MAWVARAVNSDEQGEFAFFHADLGDIEMAGADRVGLQLLLPRRLAGHGRSAADARPRQTMGLVVG